MKRCKSFVYAEEVDNEEFILLVTYGRIDARSFDSHSDSGLTSTAAEPRLEEG